MCALYGWLDCSQNHILSNKVLKKFTQSLANASEERGTDASGIAYLKDGHIAIYKRPKPAHKLHFSFPENTRAVMGHNRLTTQGNEKYNQNNHPFSGYAGKQFAFAHNGVLYNDNELRMEKNLEQTNIQTDSYIAVQLIEQQGKLDFNTLKSMAEDVQGSFTFTILDEDNTLYFVKGSSPLYLIYFNRLKLYTYASTKSIMDTALKFCTLHKEKFTVIPIDDGKIISVNRYGEICRDTFDFQDYSLFSKWNHTNYSFYDEEEEILLSMCGCLGIDEEDVTLLLEYGYSANQIEDLMMDNQLFNQTISEIKSIDCWDDIWETCR